MKTLKSVTAALLVLMAAGTTFAQSAEQSATVKLLPSEEGMVRLLYVGNSESTVTIKFMSGNKVITQDRIKSFKYDKGFVKYYDISEMWKKDITISVEADDVTFSQSFTQKSNDPLWAQYWTKQLNNNTIIASISK